MKMLLTSVLGAFLLLPFMASADVHMVGCHDRQLHCTAPLSGVALHPTWQEKRIREWRRAKAAMPPQEFKKWERHWRWEVECQRRDNNRLALRMGLGLAAFLVYLIVSRRKEFRYAYEVDGVPYAGTGCEYRFTKGNAMARNLCPAGSCVRVFYDPGHPESSVAHKVNVDPFQKCLFAAGILAAISLLVGVFILSAAS